MRVGSPWWVLSMALLVQASVSAELPVIYDSGHTQRLAPLLRPLLSGQSPQASRLTPQPAAPGLPSRLGAADLRTLLPVRSPGLTVGLASASPVAADVLARLAALNPRPLFLVGSDEQSLRWLVTHHAQLQAVGAVGLLIQAETEADVVRVAEVANGLPMTLASGTDLAAALGIQHYPVLITREGIQP